MTKAIEIEGLGKLYQLGQTHDRYRRFSEAISDAAMRPFRRESRQPRVRGEHWAIRDISLTIDEGEVVGFIGHNGAGKSTLLKILSRVTEPTTGEARLRGRVGALLEVGTGFHAELSGRENIFLNGAILGMTRRDIKRRFDEIVEFSEVGQFLDTPVKRYSSGMYVRLAFAVAAHLEPEILLVDEVLAVGDAAFQRKCLGKMEEVAGEGRTVLFVSHNMTTMQSLCQRAYLLEGGRIVEEGDARSVVHSYLESVSVTASVSLSERRDRQGDGATRVQSISIESLTGALTIPVGEPIRVTLEYEGEQPLRNARLLVSIMDISRTGIYLLDSDVRGGLPEVLPACGTVVCNTGPLLASPGACYVNVWLYRSGSLTDFVTNASSFDVVDNDPFDLGRLPPREWAVGVIDQAWNLAASDGAPEVALDPVADVSGPPGKPA
jgi:lipopolysaccharide transport system ATP-binding protein